jgi:hypothetical protein
VADVTAGAQGLLRHDAFMKSVDTKVLGRKTYEASLRLGGDVQGEG